MGKFKKVNKNFSNKVDKKSKQIKKNNKEDYQKVAAKHNQLDINSKGSSNKNTHKKLKKHLKKKSNVENTNNKQEESAEKINVNERKKNKKGKNKKLKGDKQKSNAGNSDLTIDLVKELGGDESDLKMLSEIESKDTNDDDESFSKDQENELKSLIQSLGFNKVIKESFVVADKEENDSSEEEEIEQKTDKKANENITEDIQDSEITSTTPDKNPNLDNEDEEKSKPEFHFVKQVPDRHLCIIKTGEKWFSLAANEATSEEEMKASKYWLPKLEKYTKAVWEKDIENYKRASMKGSKKSEMHWINTVIKSGTLSDKMSAYVVLLQDSPIHNLPVLETLISLVSLKSRRPCLMAMETLQKIFLQELLVEERKLRTFDRNPFCSLAEITGGNKDTRDRYLITWLFEDRLKGLYGKFLEAVDLVGKDSLDKTKIKAMNCMFELLAGNPEQEQHLLSGLVNKLGDPTRAVAAKAMYMLGLLLERHSAMKYVVVAEVERLLYRPNINPKAQYYGICFLSHTLLEKLSPENDNLASKLINIYFSFFKLSIKKGEVDTKLMSALLTGVNRAFPFASIAPEQLDQQMETMHKLVHVVGFNTAIQALTLLYQVMDSREAVTDRFYSALYRKILDPSLPHSSKQALFLNLLYKSMKKDPCLNRIKAFIKRLLQVCEYQPSHVICGILFLISEVLQSRSELATIQEVLSQARAAAKVTNFGDDDSSDEEHYEDVPDEDDENNAEEEDAPKKEDKKKGNKPGWVHRADRTSGKGDKKAEYDPHGRNPLYCGAELADLWELRALESHFHPSVAVFAGNLLKNEHIKYSGDPLHDFTVTRFLDRFVFRNPKKDPGKKKPVTVLGKRNVYRPKGIKAIAPDSKEYLNRDVADIPKDEIFLYKYFKDKAERLGVKDDDDDDANSVTSEEFNNFLSTFNEREKDFNDEDVDFAGGVEEKEKKKGSNEDDKDDDDESDYGDDDGFNVDGDDDSEPEGLDGDDDALDFDNLSELGSGSDDGSDENVDVDQGAEDDDDDFDEEAFGEDEPQEEPSKNKNEKKRKIMEKASFSGAKKKKTKFDPNDLGSLFADAEEFAHIIDENEDSGGTEAVSNKDKASAKQIKWEMNRDNFMKKKSWKKNTGSKDRQGRKKDFKSSKQKRKF